MEDLERSYQKQKYSTSVWTTLILMSLGTFLAIQGVSTYGRDFSKFHELFAFSSDARMLIDIALVAFGAAIAASGIANFVDLINKESTCNNRVRAVKNLIDGSLYGTVFVTLAIMMRDYSSNGFLSDGELYSLAAKAALSFLTCRLIVSSILFFYRLKRHKRKKHKYY